jgi:uncharacterized protein (TIGR02145 family)
MQAITSEICEDMPSDYSTMTLTDTRNGQNYRVRKMPDGKCWMIDSLKLELTSSTKLRPSDSNVLSDTDVTLATGGLTGNFTTTGHLTVDNSDTAGTNFDAWRQANPSDPTRMDTASCVTGNFVDPTSITGCGYLYNWYTATAGVGTYDISSGYVESSICPKGWRLPRGGIDILSQNDFAVLNSAMYDGSLAGMSYTTDTQYIKNWWHAGLFAGPRLGFYYARFQGQGLLADFWSSSAHSIDSAWNLYFGYDGVNPGAGANSKYYGFAIRCISN